MDRSRPGGEATFARAIEEAAGAWPDEAYPDMRTDRDIDRWLAEVRGPAREEA
jgi:hypothetical protein